MKGFIDRHLTFVPLGGIQVGLDDPQVAVSQEQVRPAATATGVVIVYVMVVPASATVPAPRP